MAARPLESPFFIPESPPIFESPSSHLQWAQDRRPRIFNLDRSDVLDVSRMKCIWILALTLGWNLDPNVIFGGHNGLLFLLPTNSVS